MKGSIWIVAVVGVLLIVGIIAIPAQLSASAETTHANNDGPVELQSNESYHLDANGSDEIITLFDNESVVDNATGTEYDEGTDYYVNYSPPTVTAINNSAADGQTVNISYSYRTADDRTNQIAGLYRIVGPILPFVFLAAVFGLLMSLFGWW